MITCEIDGADQLIAALSTEIPSELGDAVAAAIQTVCDRILDDARRFVPVHTGYLRIHNRSKCLLKRS